MKVTDYIVKKLETLGIKYVFGYQGGMITHVVDSLSKSRSVKYIQTYHEQSAGFVAEGYARVSGKIGVAISTSGPGATNLITSIGNAYFDSIPVLYITGQVNSYEYKYNLKVRQKGFQETDIVSMVKPVTKYAVLVDTLEKVKTEFDRAVSTAVSERKGPVLLDIPMNIQRADIDVSGEDFSIKYPPAEFAAEKDRLSDALKEFSKAKRPLVICGHGILLSDTKKELHSFLCRMNLPYAVSLMGKGSVDESSDNFMGMIGSYGNRCANIALAQADKVLVLGSRLDLRQTGNRKAPELQDIQFIHIDIDENEIDACDLPCYFPVRSSLGAFFEFIEKNEVSFSDVSEWRKYLSEVRTAYSQEKEDIDKEHKAPYEHIKAIESVSDENTVYTVDIGQNQMWAAQNIRLSKNQLFLTSGGMAPMGYSVPAAVGAAFADSGRKIICITGDGGFQFALQSLLLISQYNLNIEIFVLNNKSLGMITQFQSLYFDSNYAGTMEDSGYIVPDIESIAMAVNLKYGKITDVSENSVFMPGTIKEIAVNAPSFVVPKLEYNKGLLRMTPEKENIKTYTEKCENGGVQKYSLCNFSLKEEVA